jgi:hypothetical protein
VAALVVAAAFAPPVVGQEHDEHAGPAPTSTTTSTSVPGHGDHQEDQEKPEAAAVLPPGNWTPAQVAFAEDLVERTEAALVRFADVNTLPGLGYQDLRLTVPGGYEHWWRVPSLTDGHVLDPERPESLVFRRTEDGRRELVAAMYVLEWGTTMADIPTKHADIAWLPGWHVHDDEFCVDEKLEYTEPVREDGTCGTGTPALTPPMVHVWIKENPCGHRFAGIGLGGIECDQHDHRPARPKVPKAEPVRATPRFTG